MVALISQPCGPNARISPKKLKGTVSSTRVSSTQGENQVLCCTLGTEKKQKLSRIIRASLGAETSVFRLRRQVTRARARQDTRWRCGRQSADIPPFVSELKLSASDDNPSRDWQSNRIWSVVIPTYNRLPILRKCLDALESQTQTLENEIDAYEVVVVDDGSTDGTLEALAKESISYPHVKLLKQEHAGATAARNLGVEEAKGDTIVFIDSDMVVAPTFLASHAKALRQARVRDGDDRAFTYGRVVNTSNFEDPPSEPFKVTDYSAAFFATGNVAISKQRLQQAAELLGNQRGPFDEDFSQYGWEDLELGERLRKLGARIVQCPDAVGYHWHPAFTVEQLPKLLEQERQRGMNGVRFYEKHPNLGVRLMVQMTPFHEGLWFLLTFGGLVNEKTLEPLLRWLVRTGQPGLALALLSPILNWHTVQAVKTERKRRNGLLLHG